MIIKFILSHIVKNTKCLTPRNSLHGLGPTYLSRSSIPISEIGARAHLRSAAWGHLTTCTSYQDTSVRAKKLPCLRTGCVELPARRHRKSRTVIGTFQDWIENSSVSSGICLAAVTVPQSCPRVGWTRGSGRVGSRFCRILAGRVGSALRIF